MNPETSVIGGRIAAVRKRITIACERARRDSASVTLVAASKSQAVESMAAAFDAGIHDFGENYVQEALTKAPRLKLLYPRGWRLHFIGHLQTNKAAAAVAACDIVQSVDSLRLAAALEKAADGGRLPVFIQVNLARERGKGGVSAVEAPTLIAYVRQSPSLVLQGLMMIPPQGSPVETRAWFRALKRLAVEHGIEGLSMGMTDDFEVAIEEGATHVRVGRAIFGERQP